MTSYSKSSKWRSIPSVLHLEGTHYEVGYQIGKLKKSVIEEYFEDFEDLRQKFIPFVKTEQGCKIYNDYLDVVKKSFPQYLEEVRGISDGSEIPFDEVFMMHIRMELQCCVDTEIVPECSTILINNDKCWSLLHNEDTSEAVLGRGYIVVVKIQESKENRKIIENFLAYCYPGVIPGNCFSANSNDMIFSMNALYPKDLQLNRTPRQFLNRAMLCAKNSDHLLNILKDVGNGISSGCSVNLAHLNENRTMSNYELWPTPSLKQSSVSTIDIKMKSIEETQTWKHVNGQYAHFNSYLHSSVIEMEGRTISSEHRKKRADEFSPPTTIDEGLEILSDTFDKEYPIFRTPSETDIGCTVATGVFDLMSRKLIVYVGNPKHSNPPIGPVLEIDFPWTTS